jgi:hypothetical protein
VRTKLADFFSILLIAYPNEQVVASWPILPDTGLRIEREVSGRVCDRVKLVRLCEGLRVDECGGCLDKGNPILTVVAFFQAETCHRQRSYLIEGVGALSKRIVHEA